MDKINIYFNNFINSSWFKGHSQEDKKSKMYLLYPFIRGALVLHGLANKMKEYDMNNWRYFARINLFLICFDINKRYSQMDEKVKNEYKLKYGFDYWFWSILASHYIPYRFLQAFTYQYFKIFNKKFATQKMLFAGFIPILLFSYFAYPIFFKIGDSFSDLFMNCTYRIFVANYLKCGKFNEF